MRNDPLFCPECEQRGIYHPIHYLTTGLEHLFSPVFGPISSRMRFPAFEYFRTACFIDLSRVAQFLGLGTFLSVPDEKTLLVTRVLWDYAPSRRVVMQEFRLGGMPRNTMVATLPSGKVIDFDGAPKPVDERPVWWINNKAILKKKLHHVGLPAPKGGVAATRRGLKALFETLEAPLVVKPVIGSGSRHTTMHIENWDMLLKAFKSARRLSPFVIVEEELKGAVYRPTLVAGRLIATLRRNAPAIIGDGTHTIEELVAKENTRPKRAGPYFSSISLSSAVERELKRQGLTRMSIPQKGECVQLHPKINWSVGGTTTDVTDEVHPENKKLFEKIAKLLQSGLVGIDFIIEDIGKPWQDQRCGVIECNTLPYFDNHHLPFEGEPRDVAGPFWDLILQSYR